MKNIIRLFCFFALTASLCLTNTNCLAQGNDSQHHNCSQHETGRPDAQKKPDLQEILQMKRKYIESNLGLSETATADFWRIYDKYLADESAIHKEYKSALENSGITYELMKDKTKLSDAQMSMVLEQKMIHKEKMLELDKRFYHEMKKILSAKEIYRFYELENRFKNECRHHDNSTKKTNPSHRQE